MTLLELVQAHASRTGIASPSTVIGNTDDQVVQVAALLSEVLEDIIDRDVSWSGLTHEATFVTVAAEDQGALTTLAPNGFRFVLNGTIYDRSRQLPFYGPINPSDWQALKALPTTGPFYKFRLVRGRLLLNPAPPAGHSAAFEYASNYAVLASDGTTYKRYPTDDTDTFLVPDDVVLAGLRWKWKAEKGLEYAEDFRAYEERINNAIGRDATKPTLSMSEGRDEARPGIFVPPGSWNLP